MTFKLILTFAIISYVFADSCFYHSDEKSIICEKATYNEIAHFLEIESKEYKHLHVTGSTLKKIDADLFGKRSHSKLRSIAFTQNSKLTKISKNAFQSLESVEQIVITGNGISKLVTQTFKDLPKLKLLDLTQNKIGTIEKNAFYNLTKLTNLLLSNNKVTTLKSGCFNGLPKLDNLVISESSLKTIKDSAFNELTNIRDLVLTNNNIKSLNQGVFRGLTELQRLNLTGNRISSVSDAGLFADLGKVTVLDLSENSLKNLPEGGLNGLRNLTELSLRDNSIQRFDVSLLVDTPELEVLDISNNKIELLNAEFLMKTVPKLKWIDLRDNEFSCSELEMILNYFDVFNVTYVRSCNDSSKNEADHCLDEKFNINSVYCNEE